MRVAIWQRTILTAAMYGAAIAIVDHALWLRTSLGPDMSLAVAFAIVQIIAIVVMLGTLFARKEVDSLRAARSRRLVPQIQDALAMHSIGFDQSARLEQLRRVAPQDVRETLFAVLASTRGEPRDRVASLVPDLGMLEARSTQKPLERIRDLVRLGAGERFEQIVTEIAHQNLLVRAAAAEELAPHAADIPPSKVRHVLQASDARVIVAALEMLRAWRRALHIEGFLPLLAHADAEVRINAFLAMPYAAADATPDSLAPPMVKALGDPNDAVRAAAAGAAGRMGVTRAADALGARLNDPQRHVAIAAAFSLASLGDAGNTLLQRAVRSPDRVAASTAFEALEKAALGRLEIA